MNIRPVGLIGYVARPSIWKLRVQVPYGVLVKDIKRDVAQLGLERPVRVRKVRRFDSCRPDSFRRMGKSGYPVSLGD